MDVCRYVYTYICIQCQNMYITCKICKQTFFTHKRPSWGRSRHGKKQRNQNMKKGTHKKKTFVNVCVYAHNESATNRTHGGMIVIGANFRIYVHMYVGLGCALKWSIILGQNGIGEHVLSGCHVLTACLLLSFTKRMQL